MVQYPPLFSSHSIMHGVVSSVIIYILQQTSQDYSNVEALNTPLDSARLQHFPTCSNKFPTISDATSTISDATSTFPMQHQQFLKQHRQFPTLHQQFPTRYRDFTTPQLTLPFYDIFRQLTTFFDIL